MVPSSRTTGAFGSVFAGFFRDRFFGDGFFGDGFFDGRGLLDRSRFRRGFGDRLFDGGFFGDRDDRLFDGRGGFFYDRFGDLGGLLFSGRVEVVGVLLGADHLVGAAFAQNAGVLQDLFRRAHLFPREIGEIVAKRRRLIQADDPVGERLFQTRDEILVGPVRVGLLFQRVDVGEPEIREKALVVLPVTGKTAKFGSPLRQFLVVAVEMDDHLVGITLRQTVKKGVEPLCERRGKLDPACGTPLCHIVLLRKKLFLIKIIFRVYYNDCGRGCQEESTILSEFFLFFENAPLSFRTQKKEKRAPPSPCFFRKSEV